MQDYILFIDIETSDMPKRWNAPTAKVDEWPFILQIAWIICKKGGEFIAKRDFYVKQQEIPMGEVASRLHGITVEMLEEKGEERRVVLNTLAADLELYKPMIVGHFLEFDKRMLEVGFARADVVRNFDKLPRFCTMLYTRKPKDIFGGSSYLRLNELYQSLFEEKLLDQHNALVDAEATKDCFFELVKQGKITDQTIDKQKRITGRRWELPVWLVVMLSVLIGGGLFYLLVFIF